MDEHYEKLRVPTEQLRPEVKLASSFDTTEAIRSQVYVIQQNRAFQALAMGVEATSPNFHVFVVGPPGTGRRTLTEKYVAQYARQRPTPPDLCYVYNFENPDAPMALLVAPGRGQQLKNEIAALQRTLREELPKVFESAEYEEARRQIQAELNEKQQALFEELQGTAKALGFVILTTPEGLQPVPLWQGKPMTPEKLAELPEELRKELIRQEQHVVEAIQKFLKDQRRLQREIARRLREQERQMVQRFLQPIFTQLEEDFRDEIRVVEWIRALHRDIMGHLREIFEALKHIKERGPQHATYLDRYDVNVLVSHSGNEGAPVIFESNPNYYNLFGRIERKPVDGTFVTDFTMIKPGAIHRANGGYLILEALEVLKYPLVWDTLKRALERREIVIEDFGQQFSPIPVATLRPEPVPLNLRVILIGSPYLYHLLYTLDEDFSKVFKIKAEFQGTMLKSDETIGDVVRYIARVCHEEQLCHLDRGAVEELLAYSIRLAGDKDELSARFGVIADIIREAHYLAHRENRNVIDREILLKALETRRYRHNLIEERMQRLIDRDVLLIETEGEVIGQVNGLAVYQLGGYAFGKPSRLTCSVSVGQGGILNIERQVKLSGPIHDKGVYILTGFLRSMFARNKPLTLTASLTFEQGYEGVEGDSASLAELLILLSAIGRVPLKQSIAVTGSVNQRGQVQAVGGINEKIEGFFDVCARRGLNGQHGVIIPKANVRHLCLEHRVVQAIEEGKFHLWAVERVDEALEILTGRPAGVWREDAQAFEPEESVFAAVDRGLVELARAAKAFEQKLKKTLDEEEGGEEDSVDDE